MRLDYSMRIGMALSAEQKLTLRRAVLLYEDDNSALATLHDVNHRQELAPNLSPGLLLQRENLNEMVRKLSGLAQRRTLIPGNILCYESGRMVWWVAAARRPIFFQTGNKAWNEEMSGKTVLHPPLLFCADPGRLSVFALSVNARPEAEDMLYRAPYFNLYADGGMCAGNTRLPLVPRPSELAHWEKAFFETNFTHSNLHGQKITTMMGGHDALWRFMLTEKVRRGHNSYGFFLEPAGLTLEGLVNR